MNQYLVLLIINKLNKINVATLQCARQIARCTNCSKLESKRDLIGHYIYMCVLLYEPSSSLLLAPLSLHRSAFYSKSRQKQAKRGRSSGKRRALVKKEEERKYTHQHKFILRSVVIDQSQSFSLNIYYC